MSSTHFTLSNPENGSSNELPIVRGTMGVSAVDVRKLYSEQGVFTYDPGFVSTCSCSSSITYINGEEGALLYRGYPIEQLAEKSSFMEVAYLLLNGELPTSDQLEEFESSIRHHTMLNESLLNFFRGFHYDAHPMAMMTGAVGSLSAFYHDTTDINNPDDRDMFARRIIAKMPTIAGAAFKHNRGQAFMYPQNRLDYIGNLLYMLFAVPAEPYEVDPVVAKALDVLFILHADHEQNASASTVRLAGSTGANPYATIAAGIAALWGPAHGGANEAVLKMLREIGDASQISKYIDKAKDRDDPFRLMGFGHRVYKNHDPRATVIREHAHNVLKRLGKENDRIFELALKLEDTALNDDYFKEKKLYPNVDFYSGIIYEALGIPMSMFTVMFAIARTVGWVAHWCEMQADPERRIGRPRQIYTGYGPRDYEAMGQRQD